MRADEHQHVGEEREKKTHGQDAGVSEAMALRMLGLPTCAWAGSLLRAERVLPISSTNAAAGTGFICSSPAMCMNPSGIRLSPCFTRHRSSNPSDDVCRKALRSFGSRTGACRSHAEMSAAVHRGRSASSMPSTESKGSSATVNSLRTSPTMSVLGVAAAAIRSFGRASRPPATGGRVQSCRERSRRVSTPQDFGLPDRPLESRTDRSSRTVRNERPDGLRPHCRTAQPRFQLS
eukprot:scaffold159950_cov28-Tisochrysis_lutea.AAC.2